MVSSPFILNQVSPCVSQHLCQQAASAAEQFTSSLPPSWNHPGPVAVLTLASVIFLALLSMILLLKLRVVFLFPSRRISNLFMGHIIRNLFILVPCQVEFMAPFSPSSSLHHSGCFGSVSNRISDESPGEDRKVCLLFGIVVV